MDVRRSIRRFLHPSLCIHWITSCSVVERRVPHIDLTLGRFRGEHPEAFVLTGVERGETWQLIPERVWGFEGDIIVAVVDAGLTLAAAGGGSVRFLGRAGRGTVVDDWRLVQGNVVCCGRGVADRAGSRVGAFESYMTAL